MGCGRVHILNFLTTQTSEMTEHPNLVEPTYICERQHHFHRCTSTTHNIHKPYRNPSNQDQHIHKLYTHNLQQLHTTTNPINQHPIRRRCHHRPPHPLNRHTKLCYHR